MQKLFIGGDLGYGFGKFSFTEEAADDVVFPSVYRSAIDLDEHVQHLLVAHGHQVVTDDEGTWFVGDLAESIGGTTLTMYGAGVDTPAGRRARLLMFKSALAAYLAGDFSGDMVPVALTVGLPFTEMRHAATVREMLAGVHHVRTRVTDVVVNVEEIDVIPQAMGTILSFRKDRSGCARKNINYDSLGVVDIGTFNVSVAAETRGKFKFDMSGSTERGMHHVFEALSNILRREFNYRDADISQELLVNILKSNVIRAGSEMVPATEYVRRATTDTRNGILQLLQSKFGRAVLLQRIPVTGGGARIFGEDVIAEYEQAIVVESPQVANAVGYRIAAMMKFGR